MVMTHIHHTWMTRDGIYCYMVLPSLSIQQSIPYRTSASQAQESADCPSWGSPNISRAELQPPFAFVRAYSRGLGFFLTFTELHAPFAVVGAQTRGLLGSHGTRASWR